MIPNSVWNIQAQVVAATMPGTTQGIRVIARSAPRPRKLWLSRIAVAVPSSTWKTIEPPTHQSVFQKACGVARAASTVWKFFRPTKAPLVSVTLSRPV